MNLRLIVIGTLSLVISFGASLGVMGWLWPRQDPNKPVFAPPPPLPPVTRASTVVVPVGIALSAIRDTIDRAAPRNFGGKADNPLPQLIQNADFGWTVNRGALSANGGQNALTIAAPLNGTVKLTGSLAQSAGNAVGGLVNNLIGSNAAAKQLAGNFNIKSLDANADLRGTAAITARPQLTTNWRVEPNLAAQVNMADTNLTSAGLKINVAPQVKPLIDKLVNDQVATMQQRVRANPIIEQNARREWAKMCRSIPLAATAGLPRLWVEMRPVKLSAMQPKIDGANLQLILAMDAETRVTPAETKPECPFPARLDIVPSLDAGRVSIGVPIEMPFTEVNRLIDAQIKGKTFPDDGKSAVAITVKSATVEPAGADRLLISLLVKAQEQKSFFGLGGDATVHVVGRPVLDQANQVLRLTDIQLAVDSQAAFGLLGAAAHAALPYMERALAEQATIDLKPFAANARERIAAAIAPYRKSEDGVTIDAAIKELRLAGIAFDAQTLRIIGEADGTVNVTVAQLPGL